jgi:hypothetical protein
MLDVLLDNILFLLRKGSTHAHSHERASYPRMCCDMLLVLVYIIVLVCRRL